MHTAALTQAFPARSPQELNDFHSQLNPTRVAAVVPVHSVAQVVGTVLHAREAGHSLSVAGGRGSMGGQQFGRDTLHLDMRPLRRVLRLDDEAGVVEAEAGVQWPELVSELDRLQEGRAQVWSIRQKQTGADRLSLGGALSANVHGRGLSMAPLVGDIESFDLVDATGSVRRCSRSENEELFRLAIGGYGLFGIVTAVRLRLSPRRVLRRVVELLDVDRLMPAFEQRIAEGCLYGDFQFAIDPRSEDFLRHGVFSCYQPVDLPGALPSSQRGLKAEDWRQLMFLAHHDKSEAFRRYAAFYLSTHGQLYASDRHQLSVYLEDYHRELDRHAGVRATEIITELYVPRPRLADFLAEAREDFRAHNVDVVYGTVRLIEKDRETFLPWARESYACTVFNLHTEHTEAGRAHTDEAFQRLIDMALRRGGSYYLTYHRAARRDQVESCYPQFERFLAHKRAHDPDGLFQSEWFRHYREMFNMASEH
jgi:FAD/FMN-containing dehydrogenase